MRMSKRCCPNIDGAGFCAGSRFWRRAVWRSYMQAVIQGAFCSGESKNNDAQVAASCLDHLRDHLARLFGVEETAQ